MKSIHLLLVVLISSFVVILPNRFPYLDKVWCLVELRNNLDPKTTFSILTSFFILVVLVERTTELYITMTRKPERKKLELKLKNFREPVEGSKPFSEAKNELSDFNIETLKLASAFSFIVSLLIAIVGVNFLSQLVVDPKGVSLGFRVVDTILTASLLAGGTKSFHKITSGVDRYFDRTRKD
ncbi:hypothetical protein BBM19_04025 [Vibrio parahaemolyticus]|nr:hypothetical protein BBM19_04025 [Vibrio parahaemolyticus]